MSSGKHHDRLNLLVGMISAGALLGFTLNGALVFFYLAGWLFSTLLFSPDTDVAPKKRTGLLQFMLYPYSILFKHRGLSHSFLLGTLTRLVYGIVGFGILIFIFYKLGYVSISLSNYGNFLWHLIQKFDYNVPLYKYLVWFYSGMFLADLCHILMDRLSSLVKTIWRRVF
ncbi:MAG: hypothetical protein A2381_14930 [Bdellovibrionales bacterium RIFOXYB1_FULL_37_110]|nr:MAG: hypothetical protein A2417_10435 [Bdellovibrionales bacterium RIFOXYC1_FULL_37_79]OFZ60159.1 MAG: hypothetical protein A2381_14930 [Bdellovibrionales bacterium RIFOXYB1_FULL_37_110]OFZ64347.1 MAG: hypothetical protein A2577_09840 [Bdellovibrionales bacterium RIFOXYD1_FULL_36_51]